MNILITNTRAPGGLELARLLHLSGHRVFSFESFRFHLGLHSKSIEKNYHSSSPRFNSESYIDELNKVIKNDKIDMIIPCFEEAFYISKYKEKIDCENIFVDNIEKLRSLHHKFDFIVLAKTMGLSVPETYLVENQVDFESLELNSVDHVFKPCYSRYGEDVLISPKKYKHQSGSWVCQKRLFGRSFCTYGTSQNGKLTSLSIYPVEVVFGKVCTSFRALNKESKDYTKMKNWILTFVKETDFTGQIGFDFIVNENAYAIECNPRMTSGIHLFNENPNFISALMDSEQMLLEPIRDKQMNMTLLFLLTPSFIFQSFKFAIKGRDVIFKINDIWPFINQLSLFLYIVFLSFKSQLSLSKITSYDIEWNGE